MVKFYRHLRQGRKGSRRGKDSRSVTIPNAISIKQRPEIVKIREGFGDGETGAVLGKQEADGLVTLVERKSRHYLICKAPCKEVDIVAKAIISIPQIIKDARRRQVFKSP